MKFGKHSVSNSWENEGPCSEKGLIQFSSYAAAFGRAVDSLGRL